MSIQQQLTLEHPVMEQTDLKNLDDLYNKKIKVVPGIKTLIIEASVELTDFDPAYLCYLILARQKEKQEAGGDLIIQIKLPYNKEYQERPELIYKLKQYLVYSILYLGSAPFAIITKDGPVSLKADQFSKNEFVISGRFSVPIFVNRHKPLQYEFLFINSGKDYQNFLLPTEENKIVPWTATTDELNSALQKYFRDNSRLNDPDKSLKNLGCIAFFRILRKTWGLTAYLDPERIKNTNTLSASCRAGNLRATDAQGGTTALDYYKLVEPIYLELATKPAIYSFLFNMLLSSEILPEELEKDNAKDFAFKLQQQWLFCVDLVHGLTELAKNINEHSTTGFGIISSRIASSVRKENRPDSAHYSEFEKQLGKHKRKKSIDAILEIEVMDLGDQGVLKTLLDLMVNGEKDVELPDLIRNAYRDDIKRIRSGEANLSSLFSISEQSPLNHQSKRAVAHLGLLIFSKLIDHNGGQLNAGTISLKDEREFATIPQNAPFTFPRLKSGTFFRCLLPISTTNPYTVYIPHATDIPNEVTAEQVNGLEALLQYQLVNSNQVANSTSGKGKVIISYLPQKLSLINHKDEYRFWQKVQTEANKSIELQTKPLDNIFHLDLRNIKLDYSQLFRLLGLWEIQFPKTALIISNIEQSHVTTLVEINESFHTQNPKISFWNELAPVVIYSCVQDTLFQPCFYFADVLWGKTSERFYQLNRMIHAYHFNSITRNKTRKDGIISQSKKIRGNVNTHPAVFYRNHYLLPFDLLLKFEDQTLFEINTAFLLQNNIQSNQITDEQPTK